jgi:hypothetical protein
MALSMDAPLQQHLDYQIGIDQHKTRSDWGGFSYGSA